MIELIKDVLNKFKDISAWRIVEEKIQSGEMFFIKKEMDMNRLKDVHYFKLTVYRNFEEDGIKYRGSSTANIHPTMNADEVREVIMEASFAAKFVKNPYYPLVKPSNISQPALESNFSKETLNDWLPKLADAVYSTDIYDDGEVNSSEFFLNNIYCRIVNSEGVDVSYTKHSGEIEFITNWRGVAEEVELYKLLSFANFDGTLIQSNVKDMLMMSKGRAEAKPMPQLGNHKVILTGKAVINIFQYYRYQANAQAVYEKVSSSKVGENMQGEDIKGDRISIRLDPFIPNSIHSAPYDNDGFPLKPVDIIEDGVLKRYWGDLRYSYYTGMEPTGNMKNIVVRPGSKSVDEMKKEPYLELVSFSDFQMDPMTGFFGGEVRLGLYFDGKDTIPVTGGSILGNIKALHGNMYLSKELQYENNFVGPKAIEMFGVNVGGK